MNTQREKEFIRAPFLENRLFFFTSRCGHCGYIIIASSAYELLQEEEQHVMECKAKTAIAS
jgi:hypothetical protein